MEIPKNSTLPFSKTKPSPNVKPVDNFGIRLYMCSAGFDVGVSHFVVLGESNAFGLGTNPNITL